MRGTLTIHVPTSVYADGEYFELTDEAGAKGVAESYKKKLMEYVNSKWSEEGEREFGRGPLSPYRGSVVLQDF